MKLAGRKFIILVLLVAVLVLMAPKPASSATLTFETNPALVKGQTLFQSITSVATGASKIQTFFEWAFEVATEALKRQLLNMMVDQIVSWIQGGGKPKFITDWNGFLTDAADQAGGQFIQELGLGQLCSAFGPQLKAAFIPIPTFSDRSSCTFSQIGANLDAFLKDFRNGGWAAWNEMVLKPQNNIYGAYLIAWDEKNGRESAAQKAAAAEAQAGKGFLSVKRCIEQEYTLKTEGVPVCVVQNPDTGECARYETLVKEQMVPIGCKKYETITPGAVVGDLAAKAVGSDIDWLVNANDLAAYVSAITNAILNRMFSEGIGLLHSALSTSGEGGGGGGGAVSSAQRQCSQFLGTAAYNECLNAMQSGLDIKEFQKKYLTSLIDQELTYQNQLLGTKQATLTILNQSVDILNQLKDCRQGIIPAELAQVQNAASFVSGQITQIQSDIIALQVKQQEIKTAAEASEMARLWSQVAGIVNPALTYSLVLAAQDETSQKQAGMNTYQQQLNDCQLQSAGE